MIRAAIGLILGLILLTTAIVLLERGRADVVQRDMVWGNTPVTWMERPGADGPLVVIAHGFAGSRPLMQAYQIALAKAGYLTVSFDFEGHGRNPQPMRGDVTAIDGTTTFLMDELARVTDRAIDMAGMDRGLAYLGHSMASDIIIRQSLRDPRVDTVVGLSVFSLAISADAPRSLLMINGQWEPGLRAAARAVMGEIGASEGQVIRDAGGFARAAQVAPWVEHVGILYSRNAISQTISWLDEQFDVTRQSAPPIALMGQVILLGFAGLVIALASLATMLFKGRARRVLPITPRAFWLATFAPAVVTPLVLQGAGLAFVPVVLADYLALHLALYGLLAIAILLLTGHASVIFPSVSRMWRSVIIGLGFGAFSLAVLGLYLDRYVGSFWAGDARILPFLVILIGAVPAMIADAALQSGTRPDLAAGSGPSDIPRSLSGGGGIGF